MVSYVFWTSSGFELWQYYCKYRWSQCSLQHSRVPGKSLYKQNELVCGRYIHTSCNISNEMAILKSTQPYLLHPTEDNSFWQSLVLHPLHCPPCFPRSCWKSYEYALAQFTISGPVWTQLAGFETGWYSLLCNLDPIQNYGHTTYILQPALYPRTLGYMKHSTKPDAQLLTTGSFI